MEAMWEPYVYVRDTKALSDYLQGSKAKQGKHVPANTTPPVSDNESKDTEPTPTYGNKLH